MMARSKSDAASPARSPSAPDRHTRRRQRTRAQLIEAAKILFAREGIDSTRINDITEAADVGFGSFYNHFDSKEAIVEAVLEEAVAAQGAAVAAVTADLEDPAEIVAVAHRYFVELARTDPDWAWLLIRMDAYNVTLVALGPFAQRDIDQGVKTGRFNVPNRRVALFAAGGALLAVMRAVLDGRAAKDADRHHAEGVLRLLGLDRDDAAEVARRKMPSVASGGR